MEIIFTILASIVISGFLLKYYSPNAKMKRAKKLELEELEIQKRRYAVQQRNNLKYLEQLQKLINIELARKLPEKYSEPKPTPYLLLPSTMSILVLIYIISLGFKEVTPDVYSAWLYLTILITPLIIYVLITSNSSQILKIKKRVYEKNPDHPLAIYSYQESHIYTDSEAKYNLLKVIKAYLILLNVLSGIIIILFIGSLIVGITIAPTTIIIILLIIIILNQLSK